MNKKSEGFAYLRQNFPKVRPRGKEEFLFVHKLNSYSKTTTSVQNEMAADREA